MSKKSDRKSENAQTIAEITPSFENASKLKFPSSEKFGDCVTESGQRAPLVKPAFDTDSLINVATSVVRMIPTSRSPRKPRARRTSVITMPSNVTAIGHVVKRPSVSGVPTPRATMPES